MKTIYLKQLSIGFFSASMLLFNLSVALVTQAQTSLAAMPAHKTTFSAKDPFRTAVFIKNDNLVENETGEKILYHVGHGNIDAFFTPQGIIYQLSKVDKEEMRQKETENRDAGEREGEEKERGVPVMSSSIEMRWIGANPNPEVEEGEQSEGYYTYLVKSKNGYTTLKAYGYKTITYKNMYPGIDVVYSIPETGMPEGWTSGMEYNLIVHPGADIGKIKITYRGDVIKSIKKDKDGNVVIHTICGNLIEHAPSSFLEDNSVVASQFDITENSIRFSFPKGYNSAQTLTIDPWVNVITTLPSTNMGFDVDYDLQGNAFIYGAGPSDIFDVGDYFSAAKYGPTGNLLWQFNGSAPSIDWSSETHTTSSSSSSSSSYYGGGGSTIYLNLPSNIIIDNSTGNMYVGKAWDATGVGTSAIRVNGATGAYDNFVTVADPHWLETWCFAYNCNNGDLLALGGGVPSDINMGVINTNTGAVTQSNITGITTGYNNGDGTFFCQDILCGVYDNAGSLYVIMNSSAYPEELPYVNTIYKVNNTYNGYTWVKNSNFTSFTEVQNDVFWDEADAALFGVGNAYNALAINGSYLFYYDGYNVAAYNLANGNMLGSATLSGENHTALYQGGIAVDNCNNVYVGGIGEINTFTFNGSTFTAGTPISLGGQYTSDNVHDVKYNSSNNLLYITGDDVVGTYTATLSGSCTNGQLFTTAATHTCTSGTVTVTPGAGLNPDKFTYIWTNSAGSIVSQANNSSSNTNTASNLASGTYVVQVQWTSDCGGASKSDTVILGLDLSTDSTNASCGSGGSATVSVVGGTGSYTYAWSNNGSGTTISNVAAGTYTVTVSNTTCTSTASVSVASSGSLDLNTSSDSASCGGSNGSASVTVSGGPGSYTYAWSNNGTGATISNIAAGSYTVTVTGGTCSATSSIAVPASTGAALVTISANQNIMCPEDSTRICVQQNYTSYLWNTGEISQCIYAFDAGDYYVTAGDGGGCNGPSNHVSVSVYPTPPVAISVIGNSLVSYDAVSYQWFLNGNLIPGATNSTYTATQNGSYTVQVTDSNGCTENSSPYQFTLSGIAATNGNEWVKVYPNPTSTSWQLSVGNALIGSMIDIYDDEGRLVYQSEIRTQLTNMAPDVAQGVYILKLTSNSINYNLKLLKLE